MYKTYEILTDWIIIFNAPWKRQCHEILGLFFFCSINSSWAPHEQAKTVLQTFSFSRKYKKFEKLCACVVNNYADTVSPLSTTATTPSKCTQRLHQHCLRVFNNCTNTVSLCIQRLHQHSLRVLNDCTNTVSVYSMTAPTPCLCVFNDCTNTVSV